MFDWLKKAFSKGTQPPALTSSSPPEAAAIEALDPIAKWAAERGLKPAKGHSKATSGFSLTGYLGHKSWTLECSQSSRDYIRGDELRARADLKINDDAAVLIMNRPLRNALEKRAYEMYTDTLQTIVDPTLPEEMRWLAMYPEADWPAMPRPFWDRYVVLADTQEHALAWVDQELMTQLMGWPAPGPDAQTPFILMLLRGKAYLRMQYAMGDMPTLNHATDLFTKACAAAVGGLSADILL